ncbi:hypothetical protein [Pedobacter gandavensis]|uniref:YopA central domain-containing protein n=1 Tax=Pedobacter gandavensis TaxID=2679963 RepID=A0ABR6F266_9SPHI|nr:hypothetical protein [Pedobacter gandavensis]MBB2151635.1 hypothetical protein [Pedobacter gandavensis]
MLEQPEPRTVLKLDEPIILHDGNCTLKSGAIEINLIGKIFFKWFPSHGVVFEGTGNAPGNIMDINNFELIIDNQVVGSCFLTSITDNFTSFKGILGSVCILGDKSISVPSIEFEVCNLREFFGRSSAANFSGKHLLLENDQFKIQLFKHIDFSNKSKELKWKGSYQALYSGLLEPINSKASLTYEGTQEIFTCLFLFLSFLNGRRCSPIFRKGIFQDKAVWSDFTPYHVDKFKSVTNWPPQIDTAEIESLWKNFSEMYRDPDTKDFLEVAIHTYIRTNGHIAFAFEGIAMIANTLELLFNVLVVEKKKIIAGKDVENLQASNKIRLLLSQVGLGNEIPSKLTGMITYKASTKEFREMDGPEFFTQIRNSIVHGQADKRKKLSQIPETVLREVVDMSIWYVEVILLNILNYQGKYQNRTLKAEWAGQGEEVMPWVR